MDGCRSHHTSDKSTCVGFEPHKGRGVVIIGPQNHTTNYVRRARTASQLLTLHHNPRRLFGVGRLVARLTPHLNYQHSAKGGNRKSLAEQSTAPPGHDEHPLNRRAPDLRLIPNKSLCSLKTSSIKPLEPNAMLRVKYLT